MKLFSTTIITAIKKTFLWFLCFVFWATMLAYYPSMSSMLALVLVALLLPIEKWQNILKKGINGKVKVVLVIILAIVMFSNLPNLPESENGNVDPAVEPTYMAASTAVTRNQTTAKITAASTPNSTFTSTPTPTATPTPTPTATPTATPTPTPAPTAIPVLKEGSKGQQVVAMQERLIELQYLDGEADGNYGKETKKAVSDFQKNNDLTADGVAGEKTMIKLFSEDAVRQRWVWIPTSGGKKFHTNSACSNMDKPKMVTLHEAIELGFDDCARCH